LAAAASSSSDFWSASRITVTTRPSAAATAMPRLTAANATTRFSTSSALSSGWLGSARATAAMM